MKFHELTIHTTEEAIEMISNFYHELGAGGVAIEESGTLDKERDTTYGKLYDQPLNDIPEGRAVIQGYFDETMDMDVIMAELKERVTELADYGIDTGQPTYELRLVDEDDWATAWKQYFKPIRVSDRLTIKPTWEEYNPSENEIIIELDPGMAFGTGTHSTTSLCLQMLEKHMQGGEDVIDVGTGSGVLAIAAAKLGARQVLAVDLDPVAIQSANENTVQNRLEAHINVKLSDLLGVLKESETGGELNVQIPVKIVVANILAEIILLFVQDVYDVLQSGGIYIASGIITAKEELVEQALLDVNFEIVEKSYDGDWVAFVARKR
ncbi:50S ribosomal protein L11 methyltransferase [Paenibacillus albiflavus]|uniref:Ribosomal protein L11 methyltransferase n=1 Tax=Paenibacillus albiflavus TaxID=2545760 RepID=A0A4V6P6B6_9BACL|nr:50S ribosomal protein L11 methyltransferase [Paenibacillus albiflavus]TCZ77022.1 50S ribosomal protein L11 methyltransferase [Paenibacillus albiflavus]